MTTASAATWQSSAAYGKTTMGGFILNNNEWNGGGGQQTIWANSATNWGVTSTQPAGTAVRTYPEEQKFFHQPLSQFSTVSSSFAESGPSTGDWEAAYDIWVNAAPITAGTTEVMIWVDNHSQRPAGQVVGTASIGGQTWQVWNRPSTGGKHAVVSFVLNSLTGANETSGSVDILATLKWMQSHSLLNATPELDQIDWGWEVCSTNGTPQKFTTTNYTLDTGGGSAATTPPPASTPPAPAPPATKPAPVPEPTPVRKPVHHTAKPAHHKAAHHRARPVHHKASPIRHPRTRPVRLQAEPVHRSAAAPSGTWRSSARFGQTKRGGFILDNNEWHGGAGPQTIWVRSDKSWGVTSTQPRGTAVLTYPEEQKFFHQPLSRYHTVSSSFRQSGPNAGDWEAAYDIWMNAGPITPRTTEVMIWVDNHGQRPAGHVVGTAVIGGQRWQVWNRPSTGAKHNVVSFVLGGLGGAHEKAGTVNILATLEWMESHRLLNRTPRLDQIDWGWEICSTNGTPMHWTTSNYTLNIH
ncbi:MAG TPA: hypothetical protein VFN60_06855 [Acidimicrobiales bacterium]|nr:hypothetical protein [Acidimicrobiales bacterium]